MPLVTQLSEGAQPLIFPTDLSINALDKHSSIISTTATTSAAVNCPRKSPSPSPVKLEKSRNGSGCNTPLKSAQILHDSDDLNEKISKLNNLNEEEASALMLKSAGDNVNSGNMSDTSYSEENSGVSGIAAGAAADFSLCNISILNSISAMNSLIGASGNGGLGLSGRNASGSVGSSAGSGGGSFSGGHPCPECGRVYKLKSSLRNHQKWECGKEPQFQCPFCVYRAKQKMHIGRHMERMHKEKFIKLEDLKSFTSATATGGGSGGVVGGTGSGGSSAADESTAAAAAAASSVVASLHQQFSN